MIGEINQTFYGRTSKGQLDYLKNFYNEADTWEDVHAIHVKDGINNLFNFNSESKGSNWTTFTIFKKWIKGTLQSNTNTNPKERVEIIALISRRTTEHTQMVEPRNTRLTS